MANSTNLKIEDLVKFLVAEWSKGGSRPTVMVLVKMLYLIDLYFAQETGKTLTNWNWSFYNFGPYCSESFRALEQSVKRGFIVSDSHDNKFDEGATYKTFYIDEDYMDTTSNLSLPLKVTSELKRTIKALDFNSNKLLHYVYFATPPMKNVNPNDNLSFSNLSWPEPEQKTSQLISLSASKVKKAKEALSKISTANNNLKSVTPIYDQAYFQGVAALDILDSSEEMSASGVASIKNLFSKE